MQIQGLTPQTELDVLLQSSQPAHSDSGVFDRKTTLSLLFRETDRVQRLNTSLGIILLGIGFGVADPLRGIEALPQMIEQFVARTVGQLRTYDLFGRISSDEFLIALPGCTQESTLTLAERLGGEVFANPYLVADQLILLSACFAITTSRGRSPVVVLRELERVLALAKSEGAGAIQCAPVSRSLEEDRTAIDWP